jgi:hypothetical protein
MRKKPKKDRLEETECVKYMYYANASDDKTVEVLNNDCSNLNIGSNATKYLPVFTSFSPLNYPSI